MSYLIDGLQYANWSERSFASCAKAVLMRFM